MRSDCGNLFTHTDGKVSNQYLTVCREHGVEIKDLNPGDQLSVDLKYLRRSIALISELSLKLLQVIWRKLQPDQTDVAASCLNEVAYELISQRRYQLASKILDFGLNTMKKHGSELTRKMMVVNYANSEKLAGKKEKALEILKTEDWSAASDTFRICVAAVRDDVEEVLGLMEVVARTDKMKKADFQEWPVFHPLKDNSQFASRFEKVFGEPLFADKESIERPIPNRSEEAVASGQEEPDADSVNQKKSLH